MDMKASIHNDFARSLQTVLSLPNLVLYKRAGGTDTASLCDRSPLCSCQAASASDHCPTASVSNSQCAACQTRNFDNTCWRKDKPLEAVLYAKLLLYGQILLELPTELPQQTYDIIN